LYHIVKVGWAVTGTSKETITEWYKQTQLLVSADDGTSSRLDTTAASAAGSETLLLAIPMDDLAAV
jgi:hypothetical protein